MKERKIGKRSKSNWRRRMSERKEGRAAEQEEKEEREQRLNKPSNVVGTFPELHRIHSQLS